MLLRHLLSHLGLVILDGGVHLFEFRDHRVRILWRAPLLRLLGESARGRRGYEDRGQDKGRVTVHLHLLFFHCLPIERGCSLWFPPPARAAHSRSPAGLIVAYLKYAP